MQSFVSDASTRVRVRERVVDSNPTRCDRRQTKTKVEHDVVDPEDPDRIVYFKTIFLK